MPAKQMLQESIKQPMSQQLFKEQHSDQVPQFVDVQHYDLCGNEPSYQPLHMFVFVSWLKSVRHKACPYPIDGVEELRRFGFSVVIVSC